MHHSPIEWSEKEDVTVSIFWAKYSHGRVESRRELHNQSWTVGGEDEREFSLEKELVMPDVVDSEINMVEVEVETVRKIGILCCGKHKEIAAAGMGSAVQGVSLPLSTEDDFALEGSLSVLSEGGGGKTFTEKTSALRLGGTLDLVKAREVRDTKLGILAGTFYDSVMPETVESMWGPVPMRKLPEGRENKCKAVVHRYEKERESERERVSE